MGKIFNWVLAGWTGHELKVDSKSIPPVFQKLLDTLGMEDVSTFKLYNRLSTKLTCEADVAQIVLRGKLLDGVNSALDF